jgi:hypothetical protein
MKHAESVALLSHAIECHVRPLRVTLTRRDRYNICTSVLAISGACTRIPTKNKNICTDDLVELDLLLYISRRYLSWEMSHLRGAVACIWNTER